MLMFLTPKHYNDFLQEHNKTGSQEDAKSLIKQLPALKEIALVIQRKQYWSMLEFYKDLIHILTQVSINSKTAC